MEHGKLSEKEDWDQLICGILSHILSILSGKLLKSFRETIDKIKFALLTAL